jgi:hypothetical protein
MSLVLLKNTIMVTFSANPLLSPPSNLTPEANDTRATTKLFWLILEVDQIVFKTIVAYSFY